MAGGKWTTLESLDKSQRSGFYINFVADAVAGVQAGATGVVAIPVTAPWGPEGEIVKISSEAEFYKTFSAKAEGNAALLVLEALKGGAKTVMAYRMAKSSAAAKVTLRGGAVDLVKLDAKYTGTYGDDLSVTVSTVLGEPAESAKRELRILENGRLLEKFIFDGTAADLVKLVNGEKKDTLPSAYLKATKLAEGSVDTVLNAALTGGASGITVEVEDYTKALSAFEGRAYEFNVLTIGSGVKALQTSVAEFVRRLRNEGLFVQLVLGHSANNAFDNAKTEAKAYNHEGIVYHYVGAKVGPAGQERTLTPAEFSGRIAGMIAGAGAEQSVTYAIIRDINQLVNPLTHNQVREAITAGLLVGFFDGESYRIEKGINTLTDYSATQHEGYSKIKCISILDAIGSALTQSVHKNFIGKVLNDEAGQDALIGAIRAAFDIFEKGRLIKKGSQITLDKERASIGDQVFLDLSVTPIDAMEEIYTTIRVGR